MKVALNVAERSSTAREGNPEVLADWRAQRPFAKHPELWTARLAEAGLDEARFAGLFTEPAEAASPSWLLEIAAALPLALDASFFALEAKTNHEVGCLRLVAPFVAHALPPLRAALAETSAQLPLDEARVLASLVAHVPRLVESPMKRTIALEVHVARTRGLLVGETPEARFDFFIDAISDPEVLPSFWERHPVLARHVFVMIRGYFASCLELLERLRSDGAEVKAALLRPDAGDLVGILAQNSETHCDSKIVMMLCFASGQRVVYKPRTADVDSGYAHALAWLARRAPDLAVPRTPAVVSRVDWSFHELIEARSCTSTTELSRFYERQGVHLALLYMFLARDMHAENVIASGEHPVIIDLEALFQPSMPSLDFDSNPAGPAAEASVLAPTFLPSKLAASDDAPGIDISAIGARAGQRSPVKGVVMVRLGTDEPRAIYDREAFGAIGQGPLLDGIEADPSAFVDDLVRGFTRAWETIAHHRDDFIADPLARFREASVRVLVRSTDYYTAIIERSFHPTHLADGLARERVFDLLYIAAENEPHFRSLIPSERADFHRGDVPFFSMRPSTRDLVDSRGRVFPDFFTDAPFERAEQRVRGLALGELRRQLWIIRASFASITMGEGEAMWARSSTTLAPVPISRDDLIARARRIGERLSELAVRDGSRVGWLALDLSRERDWIVVPARSDLYGGGIGIALFLAHLGAVTNDQRFTDLAREALAAIMPGLVSRLASDDAIGISGLGGPLYALAHLGALWRDDALLDRAETIARAMSSHIDERLDLLNGAAGAIFALLALHRVRSNSVALEVARACGERLRTPSWSDVSFAHGATGIAIALLRLGAAIDDRRLDDVAQAAFDFERTQIPHGVTSWCHGAPGIALARLEARGYGLVTDDPAYSIQVTLDSGFGLNHSICHGDFGNLECLHLAGSDAFHDRLARVCASLDAEGTLCGVPRGTETPGLFVGIAGLGWQLLRFAEPQRIASLLTFEAPRFL